MAVSDEYLRLEKLVDDLRAFSRRTECVDRPAYSSYESGAIDYVFREAGKGRYARPCIGDTGNHYVSLAGCGTATAAVMTGSHLDSVPDGGCFDGVVGVLAGLLVLERIQAKEITHKRPICLAIFRGEESSRFGRSYLGSLGAFGKLTEQDLSRYDSDRISLRSAMSDAQADPAAVLRKPTEIDPTNVHAFVETHIEQGPKLHSAGHALGVVSGIRGCMRYAATCRGERAHSGTTPMDVRSDAVAATVQLVHDLTTYASRMHRSGLDIVMTCGKLHTDANTDSVSVVSGYTSFSLEWRSSDPRVLAEFDEFAKTTAERIGNYHFVDFSLGAPVISEGVRMHDGVMQTISDSVLAVTGSAPVLSSGAGHDAAVFASHGVPTGMLFVRNEFGSHNRKESCSNDDILLAVDVLERVLLNLANQ